MYQGPIRKSSHRVLDAVEKALSSFEFCRARAFNPEDANDKVGLGLLLEEALEDMGEIPPVRGGVMGVVEGVVVAMLGERQEGLVVEYDGDGGAC